MHRVPHSLPRFFLGGGGGGVGVLVGGSLRTKQGKVGLCPDGAHAARDLESRVEHVCSFSAATQATQAGCTCGTYLPPLCALYDDLSYRPADDNI